jgi:hypothetical protein
MDGEKYVNNLPIIAHCIYVFQKQCYAPLCIYNENVLMSIRELL